MSEDVPSSVHGASAAAASPSSRAASPTAAAAASETSTSAADEQPEARDRDRDESLRRRSRDEKSSSSRRHLDRSGDRASRRRDERKEDVATASEARRERSSTHRDRSRSRSRSPRRRRRHSRSRSKSRSRSRSRGSRRHRRRSYSRSRSRSPPARKFDRGAIASALSAPMPLPLAASTADTQLTRQCRRLYVGNLPTHLHMTEGQLHELFATTVHALGITTPQAVLSAWMATEGTFAFVEFRSVQDCSLALSLLQGLSVGGRTLRIGRPQDYKLPPQHLANFVVGHPIGIGAPLPSFATNAPFLQMLAAGQSPLTNPQMLMLLAMPPPPMAPDAAAGPAGVSQPMAAAPSAPATSAPTPVLLLENMVTPSDLADDEEFKDLCADILDECTKFGAVRRLVIPRALVPEGAPTSNSAPSTDEGPRVHEGAGTGRIFVEFEQTEGAVAALAVLHGRSFNANRVVGRFFPVEAFHAKQYHA